MASVPYTETLKQMDASADNAVRTLAGSGGGKGGGMGGGKCKCKGGGKGKSKGKGNGKEAADSEEDEGAGRAALELEVLKAADLFQAEGLLKHCLKGFRGGLTG
jgi:hypothetical protein